jgi:prophage regulatory protein
LSGVAILKGWGPHLTDAGVTKLLTMKHDQFQLDSSAQPPSKELLLALIEELLVERGWTAGPTQAADANAVERPLSATAESAGRFMRLPEVLRLSGLSRSTIYMRIKRGTFPRQISLGENTVAWLQSDILDWMQIHINDALSRS